ncbi:hypothetical protein SAMN04515691_2992 [Leifsonia sp. 98AMF]|uniref:hypothetical protein n=1 Tax=unclassified Leifsonia TaxID=2663824 RepID=UPI00087B8CB1|nr:MULTISPECIES: hypothetical protein [unclassified Leifsonia]SDH15969.1 hypothetical protein SAMN04515690_1024 [Leifsonia sp. 197AMF]SDJ22259.1 hypothetical protein SAMN04515684_2758 [Leifsonia sp. 466MF]SDK61425.1 hypothetical protein SAMN04515683_4006 [Leifsonia sp. 157MF]SDN43956.1 hypothetical protein SAMN04515686_0942 [Leifsonia sp. 509MF]SEN67103.1 hypothetical protein SAMN04515685_3987 [Leifsonia sp. 467MF]
MTDTMALPGLEIPGQNAANPGHYGQGPTETETRAAIEEIEADAGELRGPKRTIKQLAIALAVSIDKGNAKGRAVANEAGQLFEMMQHLAPAIDAAGPTDDTHLTPETRRLLDALAAPATLDADPAPEGHAEGL